MLPNSARPARHRPLRRRHKQGRRLRSRRPRLPDRWFATWPSRRAGLTNLVRIEGTSTVHDWQVEGHLIGGSAELGPGLPTRPGAQALPGVVDAKVSVFIPVRSLKSVEKNGSPYSDPMDEIMYGKLLEPDQQTDHLHADFADAQRAAARGDRPLPV